MTADEDRESRAVFALVTGGITHADDDKEEEEKEAVMTVAQLRLSLRALGFTLAAGETRALVYEFDFDNSETLRLADFQRIFLFKLLEHGERQRFNDAFRSDAMGFRSGVTCLTSDKCLFRCSALTEEASVRVCDLAVSNKDLGVARSRSDNEDVVTLDAGVLAHHLQAQFYGSNFDDAIASEADAMQTAGVEARVSRDVLAMFLRVE
jgi:hypothetical protein